MHQSQSVVNKTIEFVQHTLKDAESGHNWHHIRRVWKLAKHIAKKESAPDMLTVELGALLHDIADAKFHHGDETVGPRKATDFLLSIDTDTSRIKHIQNILSHISLRGENHVQTFSSLELDIIQDADRLNALGAIGITRVFHYGGQKNREIYDPAIQPLTQMTSKEYMKESLTCASTSINHFYEKLLLLKDTMHTTTGRSLARYRHKFMEKFLDEFYQEWEGKR